MRKIGMFFLMQTIFIVSFSVDVGREICTTMGTTTNCEIEGLSMEVTLEVPKSLYIVKENKEVDFDFGEVIKGESAEANNSFVIKGDIADFSEIKLYQNSVEAREIMLSNNNTKLSVIPEWKIGAPSGDEMEVDMKLKLNGDLTKDLASGEYSGVFTIRAILK
ncbi:MAG: hypothetical protein ACRC6U_11235 [Fusobacteriaceae bacterium]